MTHALALLEFDSIAIGIVAGDAMVKKAPVSLIQAGTVQPGRYLVMVSGGVAEVEESLSAGKEVGEGCLRDCVFLPNVHEGVIAGLKGERVAPGREALGIIETKTTASAIQSADAGLKGAEVALVQLRLADGLGGKGLVLFTGTISDVEAAVEIGTGYVSDQIVRQAVIAQLHEEMADNVAMPGRFANHFEE